MDITRKINYWYYISTVARGTGFTNFIDALVRIECENNVQYIKLT